MVLLSIKPSSNNNLVWLKFSNSKILPLFVDDLIRLNLSKDTEITDNLNEQIQQLSFSYLLKEYALRQIAMSPKTEKVLSPKLKIKSQRLQKKYQYSSNVNPSILISNIINQLNEKNLLNPDHFAQYYIKRHPKMSRLQLINRLKYFGVNYIPQNISVVDDIDKIKNILRKKYLNLNLSDYNVKTKIYSALIRQGFTLNDIKNTIDELLIIG